MTFKIVCEETATHRTTSVAEAPNEKAARLKVLNGRGNEVADKVTEWGNDRRILSCVEIKPSSKAFIYEIANNDYKLTWRDGGRESCMQTTYPMHITLVKRLLEEAGYKEVSLQEWFKQ